MQGRHPKKGGWYPKWVKNKGAPLFASNRVPKMGEKIRGPLYLQNLGVPPLYCGDNRLKNENNGYFGGWGLMFCKLWAPNLVKNIGGTLSCKFWGTQFAHKNRGAP